MSRRKTTPQELTPRPIYRQWLKQNLLMTAALSIIMAGCSKRPQNVSAVFYQNINECKADIQKRQQNNQPLFITANDCAAQMAAAEAEHFRHAPIYATQQDCQDEELECEPTPPNITPRGFRPRFGGVYLYPDDPATKTSSSYNGGTYYIYRPYTVYRSRTPGSFISPYGDTSSPVGYGTVSAPNYSTQVAPARPAGTAAKGTIKGRSSQGFGSTFKSTGSGGK